jgi:RNA polymerase sigma-70 factor (ECF subfamily)
MEVKTRTTSERAKEDLQLVKLAVKKKDQRAFKKLLARYKDSIYFMVLKMVHDPSDAEDIMIESFGKAFNKLHSYDTKYAFSTWLFKIATNNCIDFIRKKKLQTTSLDEPVENDKGDDLYIDFKAESLNPEEKFIKNQRAVSVRGMIEKLDDKYKYLIKLRYYEEYSYEEIADELNIPLGTVKAQLFRAKELLCKLLEGNIEKI